MLTFLLNILTCIICIIVLICIIYYKYNKQIKCQEKIILILCINIYLYIFIFVIIQFVFSICSLLGDLYDIHFDLIWCILNGYLISVSICSLYYGFVVQGIFRLFRTVYSTVRWLRFSWLYIIVIPIQFLIGLIIVCPLMIWNDIVYLPNEYYCYILLTNVRGMLYLILNIYIIPLLLLSLIYIRIILFIRQHANNQSLLIKNKQQRDLVAIQRIFLTNTILITFIIPTLILVIRAFINNIDNSMDHRIKMLSYGLSMAVLSIETIFVTPQLKTIILNIFQRNHVVPIHANLINSVPVGPITTVA